MRRFGGAELFQGGDDGVLGRLRVGRGAVEYLRTVIGQRHLHQEPNKSLVHVDVFEGGKGANGGKDFCRVSAYYVFCKRDTRTLEFVVDCKTGGLLCLRTFSGRGYLLLMLTKKLRNLLFFGLVVDGGFG